MTKLIKNIYLQTLAKQKTPQNMQIRTLDFTDLNFITT